MILKSPKKLLILIYSPDKFFCFYGFPNVTTSDRDITFVTSASKTLTERTRIRPAMSDKNLPATDDQSERVIQALNKNDKKLLSTIFIDGTIFFQ